MKKAYTNTIRGGGRNPLTIATKTKRNQYVPLCAYGRACNRPNCAYRHDESAGAASSSYKICKPFLAGLCSYGNKCMNRHPGKEEADSIRASYKKKTCSHGDACETEGCLFWHPYEAEETMLGDDYGNTCTIIGNREVETPTFDEWLSMNCPHPPTMDDYELYNVWHYAASGLQRDPWEVYCLMYPNNAQQEASGLNANSQMWQPSLLSAPQSSEPPSQEPQSFQEWKNHGQPNPIWYNELYLHIDPWYTDDGRRRGLEEVYELLYGPDAQTKFSMLHQAHLEANDPTPAELLASENHTTAKDQPAVPHSQAASSTGWASIAAKPGKVRSDSFSSTGSMKMSSCGKEKRKKAVVIPKECWLPSTANSDFFHSYPDPIERFVAVNAHHKTYLEGVTIPLSFNNHTDASTRRRKGGRVTLLDVHFQSANAINFVLDKFLHPALHKFDEVWIITGSGSHVGVGHQKRESGGVLYNAVQRYLAQQERDDSIEFRVGRYPAGGARSGGAFLVRRLRR
mmetsp:Transcript_19767/g.46415  ORF Transcript_19767/g.46415 Transcript_19767/m.46415 type:complete len:512 (+) Transcript_19767:301-1836(+)